MQTALDRAIVNGLALFIEVNSKYREKFAELARESLLSSRDKVAATCTSALFCPAML